MVTINRDPIAVLPIEAQEIGCQILFFPDTVFLAKPSCLQKLKLLSVRHGLRDGTRRRGARTGTISLAWQCFSAFARALATAGTRVTVRVLAALAARNPL